MIVSVRVSCQTIALWTALPVLRSQTTAVSRWLVIPTAARSVALILALSSAPVMTSWQRVDLGRIVLDPAGLREDLLVLLLVDGDDLTAVVEDHEASAGRPLIERSYVLRHMRDSFPMPPALPRA